MDDRTKKRLAKHIELAKGGSQRSRDIVAGIVGSYLATESGAVMTIAELLLASLAPPSMAEIAGE